MCLFSTKSKKYKLHIDNECCVSKVSVLYFLQNKKEEFHSFKQNMSCLLHSLTTSEQCTTT